MVTDLDGEEPEIIKMIKAPQNISLKTPIKWPGLALDQRNVTELRNRVTFTFFFKTPNLEPQA